MSKQLFIPGFPEPLHREAYTVPKKDPDPHTPALYAPIIQKIVIKPDSFTFFNDVSNLRKIGEVRAASIQRVMNTGTLSRGAASRLKTAINYCNHIAVPKTYYNPDGKYYDKVRMAFITLTLSGKQKHTDSFMKNKLLKNFIDACRFRWPGFSYVWKAETQINGNIHFHICTDHFVPKDYVTWLWNKIQRHYGYLEEYLAYQLRKPEEERNSILEAPSTKVEKVKHAGDIAKYIRKYMVKANDKKADGTKFQASDYHAKIDSLKNQIHLVSIDISNGQPRLDYLRKLEKALDNWYKKFNEFKKRKVEGRLWGCSDNLSLKGCTFTVGVRFRSDKPGTDFCADDFNIENEAFLYEHEPLQVDNPYFQVFKIENFNDFISGLSETYKIELQNFLSGLVPRRRMPDNYVYNVSLNYSYGRN